MGWTGWLVLAVSLGGLYGLGLVLYRLFLSAKSLLRAITHSRALVAEAMAYEPMDYQPAKPTTAEDLKEVLVARRSFERVQEAKAQARQRRLLKRISHIEIDKR
jgi:hypothetical protein